MPKGIPNDPLKQRGEGHHNYRGNRVTKQQSRMRCHHIPLSKCEMCDAQATDRHHKDGNTYNNSRSNIAILCRRCHMKCDGRLAALKIVAAQNAKNKITPPRACINCGNVVKVTWYGKCHRCNDYIRRTGIDRPKNKTKLKGGKRSVETPCPNCSRLTRWKTKGRCVVCYNYWKLNGIDRTPKIFRVEKLSEPFRSKRKINTTPK